MKLLLTIILATVCVCVQAQAKIFRKIDIPVEMLRFIPDELWESLPDSAVYMSVDDAARVEYWAQKGITSAPLISALEAELENSRQQDEFRDKLLENCQSAQNEYRQRSINLAAVNQAQHEELVTVTLDRDKWKLKAKKKGEALWSVLGAVGVALAGILAL